MDTSLEKITDNCCLPAEVSVDNSLASECLDIDYNSQAEVLLEEFHELETEETETENFDHPYNRNFPPPTPKYYASRKRCAYCNLTQTFFSRDHE